MRLFVTLFAMVNRIRKAITNRASFANRVGLGAANFNRRGAPQFRRQQYRNMGKGIRQLARTVRNQALSKYIRRRFNR